MTGPRSQVDGDHEFLMLLDISRAHLHSPLARAGFVTIDGKVYKLLKAMYGLRDAGAAFDRKVLHMMNLMGVSLGKFSICVGYRKENVICRDECLSEVNTACLVQMVRFVRWGDEFSLSGRRSVCSTFRNELGKHLLVKLCWDPMWRLSARRRGRRTMGDRGRPSTCRDPGVADGTEQ